MKVIIIESDPEEREILSNMLDDKCELDYESSIIRAISSIGINHVDFALVDADNEEILCDWKDMVDFLKKFDVDYAVFSSNGKVGIRNGQKIFSISDVAEEVNRKIDSKKTLIINKKNQEVPLLS